MPFTSPIAHSRSPARRWSSTAIPFFGSTATPTVSRPIPSTRGRRPVATSSRSPRSSLPLSSCRTYSSPSRRAAVARTPSSSSMPVLAQRLAERVAQRRGLAGNEPGRRPRRAPPRRRDAGRPAPARRPADPPPSTSRRRGTAFMLVASRVPQTPSSSRSPGIGGMIGSEPVATMTCSAVWRTPSTSTTPVPASRPVPRSTSMPRLGQPLRRAGVGPVRHHEVPPRQRGGARRPGRSRPRCARRAPPRPAAAATWTECRPSRSTRRRPAPARPRRRAARARPAPPRSARPAPRRRRRSRRSRSRSRRQLRPGLLRHHVRGVPVGPVLVGVADALLVLAVRDRRRAASRPPGPPPTRTTSRPRRPGRAAGW